MTTKYVNQEVTYKFNTEDAKGNVKIVPGNYGLSIFVDGKEVVYLDLYYKVQPDLIEKTMFPSEEEYRRGYVVKEEQYSDDNSKNPCCRVIPIDETESSST